jgi:folylpolyglutamate synthase/dihydropteroate synthase
VLGDKDWRAMLPPLFRRVDRALLTQPPSAPHERRWDPVDALRELSDPGEGRPCPLALEQDFAAAMRRAQREARGGTVVVTGSVHTVGSALRVLDRDPFPLR